MSNISMSAPSLYRRARSATSTTSQGTATTAEPPDTRWSKPHPAETRPLR